MNQGQIKIAATSESWFPAEDYEFQVTVSKGTIEYSIHFYGNVDDCQAFGKRLMTFPLNVDDQAQFELGSRSYSTYLSLAAYCYDEKGHNALRAYLEFYENNDFVMLSLPKHCYRFSEKALNEAI